ncbi:MAG: cytochrome P450 [Ruegeria sp.]
MVQLSDLPPGPSGAQHARLNAEFFKRDSLGFLGQLSDTFGDVASFDLGTGPIVLVNDADVVRDLFRFHEAHMRKPRFLRDSNRGHWGDGLTTLEDPDVWRARRYQLLPLFRAALRKPRLLIAAELARSMAESWAGRSSVNLPHEIRLLTARIALRTVIDADLEGYVDGRGRSGLVPFAEGYGEDFTSPSDMTPGALRMTRPRAPKDMDSVRSIIDARIGDFKDRGDVLSALVQMHLADPESLTRQDIAGEVIQMLFAGHLTIPLALTALWRDLHDYSLDEQVAADAMTIDGAPEPSAQVLGASRTMAILRESMRLSPPAPILYREVSRGFETAGCQMAEGVGLWVSPGLLHRDKRYFSDPSNFIPDRFAAGRIPQTAAKAYMPFGAGPRVCIAVAQSLLQMTVIIAAITGRWSLTPSAAEPEVFDLQPRI